MSTAPAQEIVRWQRHDSLCRVNNVAVAHGTPTGYLISLAGDLTTWRWEGTAWTRLSPSATPPATGILGEGPEGPICLTSSGTWVWRGATWELRTPTVPTLGLITNNQGMGNRAAICVSQYETWVYANSSSPWTRAPSMNPPSMGLVFITPGLSSDEIIGVGNGTWRWNYSSMTWTQVAPLPVANPYGLSRGGVAHQPTLFSSAGVHRWNGAWSLFSSRPSPYGNYSRQQSTPGQFECVMADGTTTVWNENQFGQPVWSVAYSGGPRPPDAYDTALAFHPRMNRLVAFGSNTYAPTLTYERSGTRWTASLTSPAPTNRHGPAMAFDPSTDNLILYGGYRYDQSAPYYQDTWLWNGTTWSQQHPSVNPGPRRGHRMATAPDRAVVYLFGGWGATNDLWAWSSPNWTRLSPSGTAPTARSDCGLAYDEARRRLVLFGGTGPGALGDTWEWDGTTWAHRQPSRLPSPRSRCSMAYDRVSRKCLLFGGYDTQGNVLSDTWSWDGVTWRSEQVPAPTSAFPVGGAVFDSELSRVVALAGSEFGYQGQYLTTVWERTVERASQGAGSALSLTCTSPIRINTQLCFQVQNPAGAAALLISPSSPLVLPLGQPLFCSTQLLLVDPATTIAIPVSGNPGTACVNLHPEHLYGAISCQGVALAAGCLDLSNALHIVVQP